MNKVLYIIGPTATGKTSLALELAKKFNGDLISADSRQVYQGMDIGTGKDLPSSFKYVSSVGGHETLSLKKESFDFAQEKINRYTDGKINIWGLDLVKPDEEFSVVHFVRFALPVIQHIWKKNKLPIVVGGTGLYVRALRNYLPEIFTTRNLYLRKQLAKHSVIELQHDLEKRDPDKFSRMNDSDQKNPRRLIRAIEQSVNQITDREFLHNYQTFIKEADELTIGLTVELPTLYKRIDKRVDKRLAQGMVDEVKRLVGQGYRWDLPSMSGLGYREWQPYTPLLNDSPNVHIDEDIKLKIKDLWKLHEKQYAKRQLTWFKKETDVKWFSITEKKVNEQIVTTVGQWYN